MSNLKELLLGACFLLFTVGLIAQKPIDGKDFIGAKVLFIDLGTPNSVDASITNGLEAYYRRNINNYFSVGVPLRGGFYDIPNVINNRNFFSIDGIIRGQLYAPTARFVPYVFGGFGYVVESGGPSSTQIPAGIGTDIKIGQYSYINIQAEYRVSQEALRDNLVLGLGYAYKLGKTDIVDSDQDGIPDSEDACPQIAGTAAFNGCKDTDGDGVPDPQDTCPNQIGTVQSGGCPDNDGDGVANQKDDCPDEAGTLNGCPDSDEDGIADKDDQCPEEAGLAANNGCPADVKGTSEADDDGDGVANIFDECPDVAGMANGCPDGDKDGVADKDDQCPDEFGAPDNDGCPAVVDRDNDGVLDSADECPDEAGTLNGCPDMDGDGVADKDDACPGEKGTKANGCPEFDDDDGDGFPNEMDNCPDVAGSLNGCPDGDGDGVADKDDACPDEKGTKANGCPEFVDSDGDGFPDNVDQCPDLAGTLYGCPDADGDGVADKDDQCPEIPGTIAAKGCPPILQADKEVLDIAMSSVRFESGKAILLKESSLVLNQIAAIMERYPHYHLQISGHTDNEGSPATNQLLSEDRAKSCYTFLVDAGVAAGRMSFVGYGQERPIADNKRTAGRQLNRRVEFKMFVPKY